MRLDLVIPNEGAFSLEAVQSCPAFESMGYEGLWFTDHVVGQRAYTVYGAYWLEIMNVLAYVAARTTTIRLGTGVLVVPYRDPVLAAKQLATLDVLSGGRVDLGVGTGWSKGEFHALGRGHLFEKRGAFTNEALDVMLRCWQGGEFGFEGDWVNFRRLDFEPVPVQQPRIPIWIGSLGAAKAPLLRAAKYADVWHPGQMSPQELVDGSKLLNDMAGREIPISIRIQYPADTDTRSVVDDLARFRDAGCIQAAVEFKASTNGDLHRAAERLAEKADELRR